MAQNCVSSSTVAGFIRNLCSMKNIVITGATGLIAGRLISILMNNQEYSLFLISNSVAKCQAQYDGCANVHIYTLKQFAEKYSHSETEFDTVIHTAFSRDAKGSLLADSLNFSREVLQLTKTIRLKRFVNISSQSVYGNQGTPPYTEEAAPNPVGMYAMAKCAQEILVEGCLQNTGLAYTNIRVCSVCDNARFMNIFCQKAIRREPITITAENQQVAFIDIDDIAEALYILIRDTSDEPWEKVYNVCTNQNSTIGKVAELIKQVAKETYNIPVELVFESADCNQRVGMSAERFMVRFGWKPHFGYKEMIERLFKRILHNNISDNKQNI